MAGIKHLKKNQVTISYIGNELIKPGVRENLFDDIFGLGDIVALLYSPNTVLYGIFERGLPEPKGVVIFEGLVPYRNCNLHAAMFSEEDRKKGKLQSVIEAVRDDVVARYKIHSITAGVVGDNAASHHLLKKLGFTKLEPARKEGIFCGGRYQDLHTYFLLLGDEGKEKV